MARPPTVSAIFTEVFDKEKEKYTLDNYVMDV
jgi:hypothetical protein